MQEQVIMSWSEKRLFFFFFFCLLRCLLFWMMFVLFDFLYYFFSLFIHVISGHLREYKEDLRSLDQCLTSLEHGARQSRLAMEADGQADTKTRERTEGAATAVRAMHGDSCSANRVDPDPMCFTSCGDDCTGSPALPCSRENTLVDNGDAAPKSCLTPLEMRSPTAASGLLPAGESSTATKTTFDHPTLWFCLTKETHLRTLTQSISYDSSFFWENNFSTAPPPFRGVYETESWQNRMFDSGGSRSSPRLRVLGNVARVVLWGGSLSLWSGW